MPDRASIRKLRSLKKITKASLKAFIRAQWSELLVRHQSEFDGMVDCIMPIDNSQWLPVKVTGQKKGHQDFEYTLGCEIVYLVPECESSRNQKFSEPPND